LLFTYAFTPARLALRKVSRGMASAAIKKRSCAPNKRRLLHQQAEAFSAQCDRWPLATAAPIYAFKPAPPRGHYLAGDSGAEPQRIGGALIIPTRPRRPLRARPADNPLETF